MTLARTWLRLTLFLSAGLLLLTACSPAAVQTQARRLFVRENMGLAKAPPGDSASRLVVQGEDNNLYLVSADGKTRYAVTDNASPRRVYGQPTFSPDGAQLAWTQLDRTGSKLVMANLDGSDRREFTVPYLPFYMAWSPTGDRLAYLSRWQAIDGPSMALRLVEPAATEPAATEPVTATAAAGTAEQSTGEQGRVVTLADGAPFYFAWSPAGDKLLTHIEAERVELQGVGGDKESVIISGGAFTAPGWFADGKRILYAAADAVTQRLLLATLDQADPRELTTYDGNITFVHSPDGQQVAYVLTDRDTAANTLGPLYVVELDTLRTRELAGDAVMGFFWSPDSRKLAYLTLETVNGRLGLRWNLWDGEERRQLTGFFPSRELLENYLPFFDQYAQSHRIWSPDSSAFVFAGQLGNGDSGVFVQRLDDEPGLTNIGAGDLAFWSPQ